MGVVLGQEIGKAFVEALGLEGRRVKSMTLRIAGGEPVVITVTEMECLDVPGGGEPLRKAADSLKQFNLVEVKKKADDGA